MKFKAIALFALQEAAEALIIDIMEHASLRALHAKRATILQGDFLAAIGLCWRQG